MISTDHDVPTRIARATLLLSCLAAIVISVLALAGWVVDAPLLTAYLPGGTAMNPTTALGVFMLGAAFILLYRGAIGRRRRLVGRLLAIVTAAIGGLCVASYVFGARIPIDQLLFGAALAGNRIAPNTALCLLMLGLSLLLLDRNRRHDASIGQALALVAAIVSFLSIVGYVYGTRWLYGVPTYIPMALPTALAAHLLSVALLYARPAFGLMAVVTSTSLGGVMARRLIPAAIVLPVGLGWLRLLGERLGWYDTGLGVALNAVLTCFGFLAVIWWSARSLNEVNCKLRQAADEIEDLYNRAPCGYHSLDKNARILTMNDTELSWLGYGREELIGGRTFAELLVLESRATFAQQFQQFLRSGAVQHEELEMMRKDGTTFWVLLSATAIFDSAGNYRASRSTLFDISERKRAQAELRRLNNELEARIEARTAELTAANCELLHKNEENELFVYSVSHDLRAPLVNLQGFSRELAMSVDELRALWQEGAPEASSIKRTLSILSDEMQPSLHFIQSGVMRLSTIIDALLRLSRVGRIEYQWQFVDVAEACERIADSLRSTINERGVTVSIGELPPAWGDRAALEQVFANLLSNAVNYRDQNRPGVIEVTAETPLHDGVRETVYAVRDNGVGIPALHQSKVFQAFQRLQPHLAKGEGMGLTMARRIVERHGGRIWLDSREEQGTIVYVAIPTPPGIADSNVSQHERDVAYAD